MDYTPEKARIILSNLEWLISIYDEKTKFKKNGGFRVPLIIASLLFIQSLDFFDSLLTDGISSVSVEIYVLPVLFLMSVGWIVYLVWGTVKRLQNQLLGVHWLIKEGVVYEQNSHDEPMVYLVSVSSKKSAKSFVADLQ